MHWQEKAWRNFRGVAFVFLVFYSTYFGTIFLITPVLPLFLVFPKLARFYTDKTIWFWKLFCAAIYEILFQTKIKIYGDIPSAEASTLIIMNHRTRFDWLYLFSYQVRHGSLRRYTISLKNMLKFLPGIGWAMQISGHIFLDRKWEEDKENISKCIRLYKHLNYKPQMLLFPEGTDLTKNTKIRSDQFAEKYDLQKYDFVLHPRTTGFTHFVQELKKGDVLDYLVDITIAYPGTIPQNEIDIIKGNFPSQIHFLVNRFHNSQVPSQKDELDAWCSTRWSKKEEVLRNFYEKKSFGEENLCVHSNESLVMGLFLCAWISWLGVLIGLTYILWVYPILWLYVGVCTVFYCAVSKYTKGFNILIADALNS